MTMSRSRVHGSLSSVTGGTRGQKRSRTSSGDGKDRGDDDASSGDEMLRLKTRLRFGDDRRKGAFASIWSAQSLLLLTNPARSQ